MKILYSKGNMNFKAKYRINLIIYEQSGKKVVRKYISEKTAIQHLEKKVVNRQLVKKFLPDINYPKLLRKEKDYLEYEFLDIPTIDFLIEKSLLNKNYHEIKKYLYIFIKLVNGIKSKKYNPYNNDIFISLFDRQRRYTTKEEDCTCIAVYDLNFGNLLIDKKGELFLIDYEWVFDFPLPKRFLFFRSIYYLAVYLQPLIVTIASEKFVCYEILSGFLIPKDWFDFFNFSQDEVKRYLYYMTNFQNEVNLIQREFDENIILPEKKIVNYKFAQNLEQYFTNELTIQLEAERKAIETQFENEKREKEKLKKQLDFIKSSKTFKLWQTYCRFRKVLFGR